MKTKKVILNIGLPGSGKSTWTKEFIRKNPEWVSVSRDDFRYMLRNEPQLDFHGENLVTSLVKFTAREALLKGYNVIVDNTHCAYRHLIRAIEDFNDIADIDFRYFDTPVETCIERDLKRERKAGEDVIKDLHKELKNTLDVFDFQPVNRKVAKPKDYSKDWKKELPTAVLCDVDGTISHMGVKRGPFDWAKVGLDDMDTPVITVLEKLQKGDPDLKLILISGRDEVCRPETTEWLHAAGIKFDALFMRPKDDCRKDNLIKREIFQNEINGKYNVLCVFDDRDQVVKEWRNLGIKCFQVEYGNF